MDKNYGTKFIVICGIVYTIGKYGLTKFLIGLTIVVTFGSLIGDVDLSPISVPLFFLIMYLCFKKYRKNKWENYMKDMVGKEQFENNKDYYYELKNK
jgi:hypothetical protein